MPPTCSAVGPHNHSGRARQFPLNPPRYPIALISRRCRAALGLDGRKRCSRGHPEPERGNRGRLQLSRPVSAKRSRERDVPLMSPRLKRLRDGNNDYFVF